MFSFYLLSYLICTCAKDIVPKFNLYRINILIRYDLHFHDKFGDERINVIRRIMAYAQSVFKDPTLTTVVHLNVIAIEAITAILFDNEGYG